MTCSTEPRRPTARTRRAVAWVAAAALLLQACATPPPPPSAEEIAAYDAALELVAVDRDAGAAALEEFLQRYPRSIRSDDAAFQLGELAREEGDLSRALRWYDHVVREPADGDRVDVARVRAAEIEFARGNDGALKRLISRVDVGRLDATDALIARRLMARSKGDSVEELRWLSRRRDLPATDEEQRATIDAEITVLVRTLSDDELAEVAKRAGASSAAGAAHVEQLARALEAEDFETAEVALAAAQATSLSDLDRERLRRLGDRYDLLALIADRADLPSFADVAGDWRPIAPTGTLGVVLPLSGSFAEYGEESLRGILLAARLFGRADTAGQVGQGLELGDASGGPRILVRDSGGDPGRAAEAVRELGRRDDVVAVVGPLLSGESIAAARAAEEVGVPLMTLTSRQEVPLDREQVFRLRTTPDDEVRYLVEFAASKLGAERYAILYPKDTYGIGMRERFWRAVEARGGEVVAVSQYEPGAVDFAQPIRNLIGYALITDAERAALQRRSRLLDRGRRLEPEDAAIAREIAYQIPGPEGQPLPPRVDFDALFMPDAHDKVVLIAPQLAFHELDSVQLLGSSGWNHPDLVRIARNHVRGAVVSTPFFKESEYPFVKRFVEDYKSTFETEPDSYSAHAFDAAQLVYAQIDAGADSREALREAMLQVSGYPGVSGVFTLLPDGNARKRPFLLQVRGGRLTSLD